MVAGESATIQTEARALSGPNTINSKAENNLLGAALMGSGHWRRPRRACRVNRMVNPFSSLEGMAR